MANQMTFTGEKESFIARVLIKKVNDAGVNCEYVPFKINDINSHMADSQLVTLYLEEGLHPKDDVLHFLVDTLDEKGGQLILIGEPADIDYVTARVPAEFVYKTFNRPVDNAAFASTILDYYNRLNSGDFKKRILVVDDDPQYLGLVREWLKSEYKVDMANSGLQAIKFLGKNKVDLILLDHEMPITSGPQVLEMLRSDEETKSIPVMFLTGKSDKQSVMAVVALAPEGYFLKTIQREELLAKLREFFVLRR